MGPDFALNGVWRSESKVILEEATMPISPREAIKRLNEPVTVEMLVKRAKSCTGSLQFFLDSEENHRDPTNLGVVVTAAGAAKFKEAGSTTQPIT